MTVRLAHFSDVHVAAASPPWRLGDWFSKRLTGWVHYRWLGRAAHFPFLQDVLQALLQEFDRRRPDCLVFSGDASALGFEAELREAATLLRVAEETGIPGVAVPGNHDYYTRGDAASGQFERYFAPWQHGQRIDGATYPFARQIGPLWLVAVNSSKGNVLSWNAAGAVDAPQLARLRKLLDSLDSGPRILVTHYPVALASGRPEPRHHGLRNLQELLEVAARGHVCLWLHGHRHGAYFHPPGRSAPFPIICAGSLTDRGNWSYGEYTIEGSRLQAVRRVFAVESRSFHDAESFAIELPCS